MTRKRNDIIQDTSAPPINLDVNAPDLENTLLESRLHPSPADSIVFYMRLPKVLLDHVKQIARERSYKEVKDITYQMLIAEAIADKYPMEDN